MNRQDGIPDNFRPLLDAVCDGTFDESQVEELENILISDPAARELLLDHLQLQTRIRFLGRAERARNIGLTRVQAELLPVELALPSSPATGFFPGIVQGAMNYFSSGWPAAYLIATVIFAIGALIGSVIHVSQPTELADQRHYPTSQTPTPNITAVVARITGTADCRWEKKVASGEWRVASEGSEERREGRGKVQGSKFNVQNRKIAKFPNSNAQSPIPNPSLTTNHYPLTTPHKSLVSLGDQFILSAGLMEITYNTGARVILQGPCTYEVDSAAGGFLAIGKLTARVESGGGGRGKGDEGMQIAKCKLQNAKLANSKSPNPQIPKSPNSQLTTNHYPLFTIKTPTATVTDLGTEFGVAVEKSGNTASRVFQGKIRIIATTPDGKTVELGENESARIETGKLGGPATILRNVEVNPDCFVRSLHLQEALIKPFHRWQAFSEELRKRDDLLAYYDFQRDADAPLDENGCEILRNRAKTGPKFDGHVMGALRMGMAQGRWPGKHALKFGSADDCVIIDIPTECKQITLAAWVNGDQESSTRASALLMSDNLLVTGTFHWHANTSRTMCFTCSNMINVASPPFPTDWTGAWRLMAVTCNAAAGKLTFYFDGEPAGTYDFIGGSIPLKVSKATIGANNDSNDKRTLIGRMDELMIFRTVLSPEEIRRIYEEFNPRIKLSNNTGG